LISGEFYVKENDIFERIMTGEDVDPYIAFSITENDDSRVMDTAKSSQKVR